MNERREEQRGKEKIECVWRDLYLIQLAAASINHHATLSMTPFDLKRARLSPTQTAKPQNVVNNKSA
jgi:hypothetical protein